MDNYWTQSMRAILYLKVLSARQDPCPHNRDGLQDFIFKRHLHQALDVIKGIFCEEAFYFPNKPSRSGPECLNQGFDSRLRKCRR